MSYSWSTNQFTQQIQVSLAGIYTVSVIDQNGCESSDEVAVQVLNSPNVNAGNDITVCEYDFPVTLNASGNGVEVQWSNGASTSFTSVTSAGIYSVTTTAQNGCQASDSVVVTSDPCLGITSISAEWFVYPNPMEDALVIQNKSGLKAKCAMFTADGKLVNVYDISGNELTIDVQDLSKGAYYLHIIMENSERVIKVIK